MMYKIQFREGDGPDVARQNLERLRSVDTAQMTMAERDLYELHLLFWSLKLQHGDNNACDMALESSTALWRQGG